MEAGVSETDEIVLTGVEGELFPKVEEPELHPNATANEIKQM
jgi:hypothetical protein